MACELSVRRFGSLKPQTSVLPDGSAVLVTFVSAEGAPMGEGGVTVVRKQSAGCVRSAYKGFFDLLPLCVRCVSR